MVPFLVSTASDLWIRFVSNIRNQCGVDSSTKRKGEIAEGRRLKTFSIQDFLTCQPKFRYELQTPQPNSKLSDLELYESNQSIAQIADQFGRYKPTISRELGCNEASRGNRNKQPCEQALNRTQGSSNASQIKACWLKSKDDVLFGLLWRLERIAGNLLVSHGSLYLHVYADKVNAGKLMRSGYVVIVKVANKMADLIRATIISRLKSFVGKFKTQPFDNGKYF